LLDLWRTAAMLSAGGVFINAWIYGACSMSRVTPETSSVPEWDLFFDLCPDLIGVADQDWKLKRLNSAWEKVLGLSVAELEERSALDLFHPEDLEGVSGLLRSGVKSSTPFTFVVRCKSADGKWKWISWSAVPVEDQAQLYCYGREISERVELHRALEESEERFKAFMEENPAVAWMKDQEGRYAYVNKTAQQTYSISEEEAIGRTDYQIFPREVADALRANDLKVLESNSSLETVEHLPGPDGKVRSWMIWKFPFKNRQGMSFVGGIAFNITERLEAEQTLRQMQKLDSIGRLAAGVAHDFNNIITVQQGYLAKLLSDPEMSPKSKEFLKHIATCGERASALTTQLLTFSRKQVMQTHRLNLNDIVEKMAAMLRRVLGEQVLLGVECEPDLPPIEADTAMMEQILLNLAINARDAMPAGGTLTVSTKVVQIGESEQRRKPESREGSFVCLAVQDTGCGIKSEDLERLYEPFFTTKEIGKGTGLGLPTVLGIIKQHGGWIEVESQVNHGTTFRVFLPIFEGSTVQSEELKSEAIEAGGATFQSKGEVILLVEDEPLLLGVIKGVLLDLGYEVLSASSGQQAVEIWESQRDRIQVLLTDMAMPGMTGRELAEKLRQDNPGLKVILSSGYSEEIAGKDVEFGRSVSFLAKPYKPEMLARVLRECLD